ncbi:hypothetical protein BH23PLA1_BH23PLA1_43480 [soil metagenome]
MSYATRYHQVTYGSACPLCGGSIMGGEWCGHCFAPAEVIASIEARDEVPHFLGVLGPSGVGKTVYLGILLDLLSRETCGLHGMGRGPFSLTLHRNLMLALERQRFPEKTPAEPDRWHWVHCEVSSRRKGSLFDIVTPDVAGEAVLGEIENPGTRPTVRALIQSCSGLVVLIDILQVVAEGQSQELFAMQLVTYLDSLRSSKRRKVELPVALVFTKADLCEETIGDPDAFAQANAPALWRLCDARLKRFRFFCSGVAGSCARLIDEEGNESLVPLRVEPKGVVDPFAWLATQIR